MSFATTWVGLEITKACEVSQAQKEKFYMILLMWNVKTLTCPSYILF